MQPGGSPVKQSAVMRMAHIREHLRRHQEINIGTLATKLGVSEMTIRRDLDVLERDGTVQRTHGGAILAERMSFEFEFHQRRLAMREEKLAIARRARGFVSDGQRIILDTGTTTLELAMLLRGFRNLTVITPSLAVASALQHAEGVEVILLGGSLRRGQPDLTGGLTEHMLELLTADLAFQGADAIDMDGNMYNNDVQLARADERMRKSADQVYILADHSKLGKRALVRLGHLRDVAGFITSNGLTAEQEKHLRKAGAPLIRATG